MVLFFVVSILICVLGVFGTKDVKTIEKQLTNTSLEKLNVLILNIFNINSEEDVLKIIN